MSVAGFFEFEFDLPGALLNNLVAVFQTMEYAPLTPESVEQIPEQQGVYQLLLAGKPVYIGKTDAEAGLRQRLQRHAYTIMHRRGLDPASVSFKAVRVYVFTAIDLETQLIRYYGATEPVAWNSSGFGSNDPGRERDTTTVKPEGFDAKYPIDIDREISLDVPDEVTGAQLAMALKQSLPYTFRVEGNAPRSRRIHADFDSSRVELPSKTATTRKFVELLINALPQGWQATALSSRVIIYKESREYPFGTVIAGSGSNK